MALVHFCRVAFLSPAVCPLSWTQLVIRRANIFMEWPPRRYTAPLSAGHQTALLPFKNSRKQLRGRRLRAASLTLACEQKERIAFFSSVFSFFRMKFHLDLEADKSRCGEILFCSDLPLSNVYERLVRLRLSTVRNLRGATKRHSDSSGRGSQGWSKNELWGQKEKKGC